MSKSDFIKNDLQGAIVLEDGSATAVTLSQDFDLGGIAVTDLMDVLNEEEPIERRGILKSMNYGKRVYPSVKMEVLFGQFSDAADGLFQDFILRRGKYSANVGVLGTGRPYAVHIRWNVAGTRSGDSANWTARFRGCIGRGSIQEGKDGGPTTWSFTGKLYDSPAIDGDFTFAGYAP